MKLKIIQNANCEQTDQGDQIFQGDQTQADRPDQGDYTN